MRSTHPLRKMVNQLQFERSRPWAFMITDVYFIPDSFPVPSRIYDVVLNQSDRRAHQACYTNDATAWAFFILQF